MKVIGLNCSNCGAVLEVPRKANFVTCGFCDARLKIERTANTVYTETLDAIDERTQAIADDVQQLKDAAALERLDREWQERRLTFMTRSRHGTYHLPTRGMAIFMGIVFVAFGFLWFAVSSGFADDFGPPPMIRWVGLAPMAFGVLFAVFGQGRAKAYDAARRAYETERRSIVRRLDRAS